MAKKQGISYSPNTALIQGAGVAYRNYDNMPGMYGGLDKVITAGTEMMEGAIKGFEAEEKKKQEIEKRWNDTSDQVLLNAGALGDVLYKSTYDDVSRLKQMYLDGVNEKDDRKRMEAMMGLQNHSNFIQDHKQVNLDYAKAKADGTLSSYYTKNPEGRKEAHIIEQISGQKYNKTSKGEDGDTIFHIPAFKSEDGSVEYEAMDISSKEYNDMMTPKNFKVTAAYTEARAASYKQENFEEEFFRQKVRNSLPNDKRGWNAASYDDVSGKNLEDMLRTSETLDQEIINAIDPKAWDTDPKGTAGVLDPSEKEAFIDAVMNTKNDFFNLDVSKKIMEDQLVNAGRNSHAAYWKSKNESSKNKKDGLSLDYGFRSWQQMQDTYNKIKNAGPDDVLTYRGTIFEPQDNGTFKIRGDESGEFFTKNKLKNLFELNHLDDFEDFVETENTLPPISDDVKSGIPMPKDRGLTSPDFDTAKGQSQVIGELQDLYKKFGDFKFTVDFGNLKITSPDGSNTVSINMDREWWNTDAPAKIQEFISRNVK